MSEGNDARVFISYSHDSPAHEQRVWDLGEKLRSEGVDARIDQVVQNPSKGWPQWMEDQIRKAVYVLAVCTEAYCRRVAGDEEPGKGLGATWEGTIMKNHLYTSVGSNDKFIPVFFDLGDAKYIPIALQQTTRYQLMDEYSKLYRLLTNQPEYVLQPLGKRMDLPPASAGIISSQAVQNSTAPTTVEEHSLPQADLEAGIRITIGELEDLAIRETLSLMNQSPGEKFQAFRTGLFGLRSRLPAYQEKLIDLHIEFGVSDPTAIAARIQQEVQAVLTRSMGSLAASFRGIGQGAARREGNNLVAVLLNTFCNTEDKARVALARRRMAGNLR